MLERVKNIVNTDVFDRFRFFDFFGCFLVSWGHPAAHVGVQMYFSTFFCQFWVPLGTYLEVILLAFPAVGHPFCLWASGV